MIAVWRCLGGLSYNPRTISQYLWFNYSLLIHKVVIFHHRLTFLKSTIYSGLEISCFTWTHVSQVSRLLHDVNNLNKLRAAQRIMFYIPVRLFLGWALILVIVSDLDGVNVNSLYSATKHLSMRIYLEQGSIYQGC